MSEASGRLVGTWTTELDNDGEPTFGLVSFSADGGVTSTQTNTKNIGLGNWALTGEDTFEYNFHILATDEAGKLVGEAHINVEGEFVSDTRWEGLGGASFYDPQGNRQRGHGGSKVVAVKYGIDK
ncbi:hypothetical protein [Streptomyces sp. SPB162]|jgi:hypothetical protein|uniref:hypothetical protein n=1 Tax=Streptomyces sp. SPB162 TaxID=2940560 RepID=UPI002405CA87|nr:hypothetical protein [Streptomyces sp. SPB162]MDF9816839.1 hypothetical protein [Streptomyces sp. SPB162]